MDKLKRTDDRESYSSASVVKWDHTRLLPAELGVRVPPGALDAECAVLGYFVWARSIGGDAPVS